MLTRRALVRAITGAAFLAALATAAPAAAQEVVTTGPPPELRKHMQAFVAAFNSGSAEQWEAMAKTVFTADFYKKQTADDRKADYTKWSAALGKIQVDHVERMGPEEPIQLYVNGAKKAGVFWIDLDEAHRFAGIRLDGGAPAGAPADVRAARSAHRRH